jgi:hypothetical protein
MFPTSEIYLQAEVAYRRDRMTQQPRGRAVRTSIWRRRSSRGHTTAPRRGGHATISPAA